MEESEQEIVEEVREVEDVKEEGKSKLREDENEVLKGTDLQS